MAPPLVIAPSGLGPVVAFDHDKEEIKDMIKLDSSITTIKKDELEELKKELNEKKQDFELAKSFIFPGELTA